MRVFISYRRADGAAVVERLRAGLVSAFGADDVFFDVDSIPPGTDFRSVIRGRLMRMDAVVAVIGPNYASSRLHEPDDYVRYEIATALSMGFPLIPALLEDAPMPSADLLPPDVAQLSYRTGLPLRAARADEDIAHIVAALRAAPKLSDADRARTVVIGLPAPLPSPSPSPVPPVGHAPVAHAAAKTATRSVTTLTKSLIAAGGIAAVATTGVLATSGGGSGDRVGTVLPTAVTAPPATAVTATVPPTSAPAASASAATTVASGGVRVTLGSTIDGAIESPGAKDVYVVRADAGQATYLRTPPSSAGCGEQQLVIEVVRPDKRSLTRLSSCALKARVDFPVSGDYEVVISDSRSWTGTYQVELGLVRGSGLTTDDEAPVPLGSTVDGAIETPGTKDVHLVRAEAGQAVYLRTPPSAGCGEQQLVIEVVRPDKRSLTRLSYCALKARVDFPVSGDYEVVISDSRDWTGTYQVELGLVRGSGVTTDDEATITVGVPLGGTIETPGTRDVYELRAEAGQAVFLRSPPSAACGEQQLVIEVVRPDEQTLTRLAYCRLEARVDFPVAGEYRIVVSDGRDWTGSYQVELTAA